MGPIVHRDGPTPHDHQVWAPRVEGVRRIIRDVDTGKVIDDCIPELVADEKLFRELPEKRNLRVEVAQGPGPDISEIYSPPRIALESGLKSYAGTRLRPGWSLVVTASDPETGTPWDLSDGFFENSNRTKLPHV